MLVSACGGRSHRHQQPVVTDPGKLHVEVNAGGSHEDALRAGAEAALARLPFALLVDSRGEVELEVDVADMSERGDETVCRVKVLVLRLPQDALLGIADGGARVRGTDRAARQACAERLTTSLVRGKARSLLRRELRTRR